MLAIIIHKLIFDRILGNIFIFYDIMYTIEKIPFN
jgi:hypothetical protein